ncbi:MAG: hypothetical protein LQ337_004317 [Flavoplaca oasis]|nr:MAG: hypothetical protein LQ337_004317 [Flavoplaca oasis]
MWSQQWVGIVICVPLIAVAAIVGIIVCTIICFFAGFCEPSWIWHLIMYSFNSIEKVNDLQDEVRSLEKRLETKEAEWKVKENHWSSKVDAVAAKLLQASNDLREANGVASILRWQIRTFNKKGSPHGLVRDGPDECSNPGVRFEGQCADKTRRMPFSTSGCWTVHDCPQDQLRTSQTKNRALYFGAMTKGIKSAGVDTDLYHLRQRLLHKRGADDPSTQPVNYLGSQMKLDDSDKGRTETGEQVNRIHGEHRRNVEELKRTHRVEVGKLKGLHRKEINELKAGHAEHVSQLNAERENTTRECAKEMESSKLGTEHSSLVKEHKSCEPRLKQALKDARNEQSGLRRRAEGAEQRALELTEQMETLRAQATEPSEALKELEKELGAAQAELKAHVVTSAKAENRARAAFFESFRNGFDILPTASKDFLYDAAQRKNYFSAEEIFIALDQWAADKNLKFQLGYIRRFGSCRDDGSKEDSPEPGYAAPVLVSGPHDDAQGRIVIWIHYTGGFDNDPTAHWSGMRQHIPLKPGGE